MRSKRQWLLRLLLIAAILLPALAPTQPTQAHLEVDVSGSTNAIPSLSLPQVIIPPGVEVVLDLKLVNNPGDVQGIDLTLAYSPAVAELLAVAKGSLPGGWMLTSNVHPNGLVGIGLAGAPLPAGNVVLARLTFRGIGQKGQTSAVAFQRAQINEVDVSGNAQTGQITIDTPPVTDLRATVSIGDVRLMWTHVGSDVQHYEIWRAEKAPYFIPGQSGTMIAGNISPSDTSFLDDQSGLGDATMNGFYAVVSVDAAGRPSPVIMRVGEFDFSLTPGSQ